MHIDRAMKNKIESLIAALITKHELSYDGEAMLPDVHEVVTVEGEIRVIFEDEGIAHLIAGNVACSIYDEYEKGILDLGYNIDDTDGCVLILSKG
jgi:hypothetical protein